MTDDLATPDIAPDDTAKGIEVDANGDPVRQGSLMDERQSYERVIEGLKMISDACAHLIRHEPDNAAHWRGYLTRFDKARRICVQHARLGLVLQQQETAEVRGEPIPWKDCRKRFLDGVIQAEGGCRQLATCHRGDLWWSQMADTLADMARKLRNVQKIAARQAVNRAVHSIIRPFGEGLH